MDRKGRCDHDTAKSLQAKCPCIGIVEGRRAVIDVNTWDQATVTKDQEHYVTATFLRDDIVDYSGAGLPQADSEARKVLDGMAWGDP